MRSLFRVAIAVGLVGLLAAPALADRALVGKWQATWVERKGKRQRVGAEMKMQAEFKTAGVMISTITYKGKSQRLEGRWKVRGGKLTTNVGRKTETMRYDVSGKKLVLTNIKTGQRLFMKRL